MVERRNELVGEETEGDEIKVGPGMYFTVAIVSSLGFQYHISTCPL